MSHRIDLDLYNDPVASLIDNFRAIPVTESSLYLRMLSSYRPHRVIQVLDFLHDPILELENINPLSVENFNQLFDGDARQLESLPVFPSFRMIGMMQTLYSLTLSIMSWLDIDDGLNEQRNTEFDYVTAFLIGFRLLTHFFKYNAQQRAISSALTKLATAFPVIPAHVTDLNLSLNNLGMLNVPAPVLAMFFASIPDNVVSLSLCDNKLQHLSIESLQALNGALPEVKTIRLSFGEVDAMTPKQLWLLKKIFPLVNPRKDIVLVDEDGLEHSTGPSLTMLRHLGVMSSLQDMCGFFIAKKLRGKGAVPSELDTPLQLQELVASF